MSKPWREYTRLGGKFWYPAKGWILAPVVTAPNGVGTQYQLSQSKDGHSELLLHAPRMPNITVEGGFGLFLGLVFMQFFDCLLIWAGYLANEQNYISEAKGEKWMKIGINKEIYSLIYFTSELPLSLPKFLVEYGRIRKNARNMEETLLWVVSHLEGYVLSTEVGKFRIQDLHHRSEGSCLHGPIWKVIHCYPLGNGLTQLVVGYRISTIRGVSEVHRLRATSSRDSFFIVGTTSS